MEYTSLNKYLHVTLFSLFVLIDQFTKYIFFRDEIEIGSIFSITPAKNTGISFGLFQGYNWIAMCVVVLILVYFLMSYFKSELLFFKYKITNEKIALVLIIAGGFSNLIDRIVFGFVRDFFSVKYFSIFNVADSLNTIGFLLLLYLMIKQG